MTTYLCERSTEHERHREREKQEMKKLAKQLSEISDELQKETEEFQKKLEKNKLYQTANIKKYNNDSSEYSELNDLQSDIDFTTRDLCQSLENIFNEYENIYIQKLEKQYNDFDFTVIIESKKELPEFYPLFTKIERLFTDLLTISEEALEAQNYCNPYAKTTINFIIRNKETYFFEC